ncbi:hypothetical protein CBR_g52634 [Chara braunii]|uniref:Ubiquitin-like domain-containing protein n=1 Tax=Chara braunii TaxID=69332 RepID=A0A388MAL7_CHABU|nr:hypothetical protein CBR_g52634 [Chara braunii]|eukprot:GBG91600.1 hypothetical protein CBR_g52634 [Chara braunii]
MGDPGPYGVEGSTKVAGGGGGGGSVITLLIKNQSPVAPSDFRMEMPVEATVGAVKQRLQRDYAGHPDPACQKLIVSGQLLKDGAVIKDVFKQCNLDEVQIMHLVVSGAMHQEQRDAGQSATHTLGGASSSSANATLPGRQGPPGAGSTSLAQGASSSTSSSMGPYSIPSSPTSLAALASMTGGPSASVSVPGGGGLPTLTPGRSEMMDGGGANVGPAGSTGMGPCLRVGRPGMGGASVPGVTDRSRSSKAPEDPTSAAGPSRSGLTDHAVPSSGTGPSSSSAAAPSTSGQHSDQKAGQQQQQQQQQAGSSSGVSSLNGSGSGAGAGPSAFPPPSQELLNQAFMQMMYGGPFMNPMMFGPAMAAMNPAFAAAMFQAGAFGGLPPSTMLGPPAMFPGIHPGAIPPYFQPAGDQPRPQAPALFAMPPLPFMAGLPPGPYGPMPFPIPLGAPVLYGPDGQGQPQAGTPPPGTTAAGRPFGAQGPGAPPVPGQGIIGNGIAFPVGMRQMMQPPAGGGGANAVMGPGVPPQMQGDINRPGHQQPRLLLRLRIDLMLLFKLILMVCVFNQDGSSDRLLVLSLLAAIVYLYQTGALSPLMSWLFRSTQRAMRPQMQHAPPAPAHGGLPGPENPPGAPIQPGGLQRGGDAAPARDNNRPHQE